MFFYSLFELSDLIGKNADTQQLEFQYYDDLRDCYYNAGISPVWNQALEELSNRRDMTDALKGFLERSNCSD